MSTAPAADSGALVYTLLLLFGFTSALAQRSLDPLTIRISEDLLVRPETVALLSTAIAVPFALVQPVLGPLGDHFGKDKIIKGALWLLALSTFASAFVPAFLWLMGLRVLSGAASGGIIPISQAIVADLYTGHKRQICIARITMAAFIGQLAGASFAGLVVGWIGWRGVLLACSTVVFAAAILASIKIPRPPPLNRGPLSIRTILRNYGSLFRMPRAWACYTTGFMQSGTLFGLLPFIAYLLENAKNGGPREAGLVIARLLPRLPRLRPDRRMDSAPVEPPADDRIRCRHHGGQPVLLCPGLCLDPANPHLHRRWIRLFPPAQCHSGRSIEPERGITRLGLLHARLRLLRRHGFVSDTIRPCISLARCKVYADMRSDFLPDRWNSVRDSFYHHAQARNLIPGPCSGTVKR